MRETNLTGADLSNALMLHADLRAANLTSANLSGAVLGDAELEGAKFSNTVVPDGTLVTGQWAPASRPAQQASSPASA